MDWLPRRRRVGPPDLPPGSHRTLTLVTRAGCHLCEVAEVRLAELAPGWNLDIVSVDVDSDPDLVRQYSDRVPVFLLDGVEHGYWRLEEDRLREALER